MKNNPKRFTYIILIGTAVVLMIVGTYFGLLKILNNENSTFSLTTKTTQTASINWKSYQDKVNGYEIKYPSFWLEESNSFHNSSYKVHGEGEKVASNGVLLKIRSFSNASANPDLRSYLKELGDHIALDYYPKDNDIMEVNFGDKKFLRIAGGISEGFTGPTYFTEQDPTHYLAFEVDGHDDEAIIKQILSTFKFTESTAQVDTSNWKTYTNTLYGFEFKFPQNWFVEKFDEDHDPLHSNIEFSSEAERNFRIIVDTVSIPASGAHSIQEHLKWVNGFSVFIPHIKLLSSRDISVSGLPAIQRVSRVSLSDNSEYQTLSTYIKYGTILYYMEVNPGRKYTEEDERIYNEILSTFKFTK